MGRGLELSRWRQMVCSIVLFFSKNVSELTVVHVNVAFFFFYIELNSPVAVDFTAVHCSSVFLS